MTIRGGRAFNILDIHAKYQASQKILILNSSSSKFNDYPSKMILTLNSMSSKFNRYISRSGQILVFQSLMTIPSEMILTLDFRSSKFNNHTSKSEQKIIRDLDTACRRSRLKISRSHVRQLAYDPDRSNGRFHGIEFLQPMARTNSIVWIALTKTGLSEK